MRKLKFFLCAVAITIATSCQEDQVPKQSAPDALGDAQVSATARPPRGYPNYNTSPLPPDATGMPSNALQLYAKLGMGINIGNTLEAIGGETAWGKAENKIHR
jgi:hypothetical protein